MLSSPSNTHWFLRGFLGLEERSRDKNLEGINPVPTRNIHTEDQTNRIDKNSERSKAHQLQNKDPRVRHFSCISELVRTLRIWVRNSFPLKAPQSKQEGSPPKLVLFVFQPWLLRPTLLKRRMTVSVGSWMPTGMRWSCWNKKKNSSFEQKKTSPRTSSSSSCSKPCKACSRYPGPGGFSFFLFFDRERNVCIKWKCSGSHMPGKVKEKKWHLKAKLLGKESANDCLCKGGIWRKAKLKKHTLEVGNRGRESRRLKGLYMKFSLMASSQKNPCWSWCKCFVILELIKSMPTDFTKAWWVCLFSRPLKM